MPEEVLVSLYQCAELAIFPSLYEGYGLPVVESMACGAPTMAGDNSSLQEILPRDARFQPADPGAIAEAIVRGLTDKPFRERLVALANQRPPTWEAVADKAAGVFEELLRRSSRYRPGWRRRPQFALVGVPRALADAVAAHANVDRYEAPANGAYKSPGEHKAAEHPGEGHDGRRTQGRPRAAGATGGRRTGRPARQEAGAQEGVDQDGPLPLSALAKIDPWRGGYDAIIGWVPELAGREAKVVERLAAEWPGRVVALFDQALLDQALLDHGPA